MGLDNGIVIEGVKRKQLPIFIHFPFDKDYKEDTVDICYWRKWWGFRNDVVRLLHMSQDEYRHRLSRAEVALISDALNYFLKEDLDGATHGYWEKEVVRATARESIWNLFWLRFYMYFHPDAKVYFYDSY